jgi:hypothetical protein
MNSFGERKLTIIEPESLGSDDERLISPLDAAISMGLIVLPACELRHGPIAQLGQSRRLITGRSQVRILVGPLDLNAVEERLE